MNAISITKQAELEIWRDVRRETCRRLTSAITIGFVYLLAALAVGAFLFLTISEVGNDFVYLENWEERDLGLGTIAGVAKCYLGLAFVAIVSYVLVLLFIHQKLPADLSRIFHAIPWVGSTISMMGMAEFCESYYRSMLAQRTDVDALAAASSDIGDPVLRRWSNRAGQRADAGQPLSLILRSSPIDDQPLSIIAAFINQTISSDEAKSIWHHAARECHTLVQSRLHRSLHFLHFGFMLTSVALAALAMMMSTTFMATMINGLI
ncbi:hypothetical protein LF1_37900 [Rubripirellula obstinata]|uniref:Bacterial type II secretion system protein F domain protein n=1 Tax=Rubripirellula obstinata TaxID=406547 RepID=A0A5B1CPU2_9BACT|nr:hypothetical protein [Rubripirellula obstinata]KAA1261244.1 hypothetical protein LF1_37900 [Rubripirellula obstinata]